MVGSSGVDIESWSSWGVRYSVSRAEASFIEHRLRMLAVGMRFIVVGVLISTLLCGCRVIFF